MLTFIDVTYSRARLGLFSSANILAIISLSFHYIISYHFAYFLILGRVKCSPFLFSQPKQLNLVHRSSRLTVH